MKALVLFTSLFIFSNALFSQFGEQNIIAENDLIVSVTATGDMDNDGDMDIISGSAINVGGLKWYENDGSGVFSQAIDIPGIHYVRSIQTSDLDGDGDQDLVLANLSIISWFENDGNGNFSDQLIISEEASNATSVFTSDLDNDGDEDVISASSTDDKIAWYENDGIGDFSTEQIISEIADYARSVLAADLDNDGDIDVLSASSEDNKLAWYENDGNGNFGNQLIISSELEYARFLNAQDLDGDGDKDVISSKKVFIDMYNITYLVWFENLGFGSFGPEQIISSNIPLLQGINACDLDNDGDIDILAACHEVYFGFNSDLLAWYENDGNANFGDEQPILSGVDVGMSSVDFADIDTDGDMDVISTFTSLNDLVWFENQITLNIQEDIETNIQLYPNPMTEMSYLFFDQTCSNCTVRMTNSSGQIVREYENISKQKLSIERKDLATGTYILQVINEGKELKEFVLIIN